MVYDYVRLLTIIAGAASLLVGAFRFHRWFCKRPSCLAPPAFGLLITVVLTGSALDAYTQGAPGGVRTWLILAGQLAVLVQAFMVTDAVQCRAGATGRWAPRARR